MKREYITPCLRIIKYSSEGLYATSPTIETGDDDDERAPQTAPKLRIDDLGTDNYWSSDNYWNNNKE